MKIILSTGIKSTSATGTGNSKLKNPYVFFLQNKISDLEQDIEVINERIEQVKNLQTLAQRVSALIPDSTLKYSDPKSDNEAIIFVNSKKPIAEVIAAAQAACGKEKGKVTHDSDSGQSFTFDGSEVFKFEISKISGNQIQCSIWVSYNS